MNTNPIMEIKAVAFDIDGTLYPYYKMLLTSIFLFLKYSRFMYHFSRVRKEIRKTEYAGNFRKHQAELLSKRLKLPVENVYKLTDKIIYSNWEKVFKNIKPFPHVRKVLLYLKKRGLKLAVLSDFPVCNKLKYLGIQDLLDFAFSSEEFGYLKPHPIPFKKLCQKLGLKPAEILYVGDKLDYDIKGAKAAGLKAACLTGKERPEADFCFKDYGEFIFRYEKLTGQRT